MYYVPNASRKKIKSINPGKPKKPAIKTVSQLRGIKKLKKAPIKLKAHNKINPKNELTKILKISFNGFNKMFPIR